MRLAAEWWGSEWQTLVAIIMSARTRDETTIAVATKLFAAFPAVAALAHSSEAEVAALIRPVNFYQNKTKNIIALARTLIERPPVGGVGSIPHTMEELITLPGVGRKTASVFLTEVGQDAIGVDTHVSYISQKLGWTRHHDPKKIEEDLKKLFPQKYWNTVNRACVRFGKTHTSRREKDRLLAEIKTLE